MARLIQPKTPEQIQKVGVKTVRDNYNALATDKAFFVLPQA
jgi:hypothetical protein